MRGQTKQLKYRLSALLGKSLIRMIEFFIALVVKREVYLDNNQFSWVKEIENNFFNIQSEYLDFKKNINKALDICRVSEEQYQVIDENKWDFIPLYSYGEEVHTFTKHFPMTRKSLNSIPNMTTAFFSILKPDSFIKEHRGAYKGYLRYQLAVMIPEPRTLCGIKIDEKTYHWTEGKSVIFDDTFLHTAWNKTQHERVVLYVDFIRPMPTPLLWISKWLTKRINRSPFIQNILKNMNEELKKLNK